MIGRLLSPCIAAALACSAANSAPLPVMLQVGAFDQEEEAETASARFQQSYAARLGSAGMEVRRVDLGPAGTWYRVLVGPFASQVAAERVCAAVRSGGGTCFFPTAEEPEHSVERADAAPSQEPLPPWIVAAPGSAARVPVAQTDTAAAPPAPTRPVAGGEFERALREAEEGDAKAQLLVAGFYRAGQGAPRNLDQALRWYRTAAEKGLAEAQFELGKIYDTGTGGPRDPFEAVRWYRIAAQQGYGRAQYNLGVMHGNGEGVPLDYVKAYMWFSISEATLPAVERETARNAKGQAAQLMMPEDFVRALEMAQRCLTSAYQNCD